jgi:hypothetical protein
MWTTLIIIFVLFLIFKTGILGVNVKTKNITFSTISLQNESDTRHCNCKGDKATNDRQHTNTDNGETRQDIKSGSPVHL